MSRLCWKDELQQRLSRLRKANPALRIAVVGIGQELRGDDAAGVAVARILRPLMAACERVLVIDAGPTPENYTGLLRRFMPDLVLLVDAAQMGAEPGMARWLEWQATSGLSASSHTMPLYLLANYLTAEMGCEVALVGIQGSSFEIGEPLSPIVRQVVQVMATALAELLAASCASTHDIAQRKH